MSAVLRGSLSRRLDLCSPDELRVVSIVLDRLERRRWKHGSLDLARRPDVYAELNEGLIDAVIACTILTIRAEDERHDEERRKALLASAGDDERAELARWQADDQRTRVSTVPASLAATPEAVPEPVVEWEAGEGPHARRGRK